MNAKPFALLLVGVILLGGAVGGALIGGMALAKGQSEDSAPTGQPAAQTSSLSQQSSNQFSQQFPGQFDHTDDQGFAGGNGLSGTIESLENRTVTVSTSQGPLQVTIGSETSIQQLADGTLSDLRTGLRVTVIGGRAEDGTVQARTILVNLEGADEVTGVGFLLSRSQQHDQESSSELSQGQHAQFGQQFQGQFDHSSGQVFSGRDGLSGAIEKIEGNVLTVNTPQGPLQSIVEQNTVIRFFTEAALADLQEGARVTVNGQRGEDGTLQAMSVLVISDSAGDSFGEDFVSRDHQQPDQQLP